MHQSFTEYRLASRRDTIAAQIGRLLPILLFVMAGRAVCGEAAATQPPRPTSIAVYPPQVELSSADDRQLLVIQSVATDGTTDDVTASAVLALRDPDIAVLNGNLLKPLSDGRTELIVTYAGHEVRAPVVVRQAHSDPPIGFRRDVMPVFLKAGCNTSSCHGSARGQDGFHLSLFGFDPEGDYYRLTREVSGRRINLGDSPHTHLQSQRQSATRRWWPRRGQRQGGRLGHKDRGTND